MKAPVIAADVLVVGGGAAGLGAACAAAEAGARVVLLERYGFLGGLAAAAAVGTVCGLYLRDEAGPRFAAHGFARRFAERLAGGRTPVAAGQGLWVLPYEVPALVTLADALVAEAKVDVVLRATLTRVTREGEHLLNGRAVVAGGEVSLKAAVMIDTTGDAAVARFAGLACEDVRSSQTPSVVVSLDRPVRALADPGARLALLRALARAAAAGELPAACGSASLVPGDFARGDPVRLKIPLSVDPGPAWSFPGKAERAARGVHRALAGFLAARPVLADARVDREPVEVGLRATFRAEGLYTMTGADVRAAVKHADGIARCPWPAERWSQGPSPRLELGPAGDFHEVPLRALQPRGVTNLLVAGRAVSADADGLASVRVIGTCLDTGYAAGVAAACVARGEGPERAVEVVRARLAGEAG